MIDFFNANPGLSAIIAIVVGLAAVGTIQWKILFSLYVKPREFELERLARRLDEASKAYDQPPSRSPESLPAMDSSGPTTSHLPGSTTQHSDPQSNTGQQDTQLTDTIESFFRRTNSTKLTELEKDAKQQGAIGAVVRWAGKVNSVRRREDGGYSVFISPSAFSRVDVFCEFDERFRDKIANLKRGQKIRVRGTIREVIGYYASLDNCDFI